MPEPGDSPLPQKVKNARHRRGVARRLDEILAEIGDLRETINVVLAERQAQQQESRRAD